MSSETDWISAIGQAAGAAATAGALWIGAITLRHQVNDQRKSQAKMVSVRVHEEPSTTKHPNFRVLVANNSPLPIYELHAYSRSTLHGYHEDVNQAVLLPGETADLDGPFGKYDNFTAGVRFRDNSGLWWNRWDDGYLVRIKNPHYYGLFERMFAAVFKRRRI